MDAVSLAAAKKWADQQNQAFGYNMKDSLIDYRIGLSERASTPCKIYCIGDSITRGEFTSDEPNTAWACVLRKSLQAKYGNAGEGFINVYEGTLPAGSHSRVTFGAGWALSPGSKSGFGGCYANSTGATTPLTINFTGDKFTIIYTKGPTGGNADVKIDGTSIGTLSCTGATITFNNYQTFTGLTVGAHVLTIVPANTTQVWVQGILAEISATGVQVHRIGYSGYVSGDWNNANTKASWAGKPPHLAIIALGINDGGTGVSLTTYKNNMEALVQHFISVGSSVILLPYMTSGSGWATAWPNYVKVNYELSKKYNTGLIDIYQAWGKSYTFAQTRGLYGPATNDFTGASGSNTAHPGDKGHRYIASIVEKNLI
jgi:lysophospholipase L1-like esterase